MSFIGLFEVVLILVVALVILGPEKLFVVVRHAGLWLRKLRGFYGEVSAEFDQQLRLDEMLKNDQAKTRKKGRAKPAAKSARQTAAAKTTAKPTKPAKRGRPKGSKNKPRATKQ